MFSFSKTPILIREQRPESGEIGKKGLLVPHRDHSLLLLETVPVLKSAVALGEYQKIRFSEPFPIKWLSGPAKEQ